jgi:hypothetical protein
MVEYLPFAAYTVGNGGVFKHNSENSTTAEKVEVDYLVGKARDLAQYYTDRFITYMSYNQATFPEYYLNSNADVYPDTDANFALGFFDGEQETDVQTETEQHSEAQKLFRREWEYKAIGDREQQTMTSIGVRLPQRIVSLGVWFSHCLMVTRLRTCTEATSRRFGSQS